MSLESPNNPLSIWRHPGHSAVLQYEIGPMQNLVYLLVDWISKQALWVDPQRDLTLPLHDIQSFGLKLCGILLTHTHHDHTAGVPALLKQYPDLPIYLHERDAHRLESISPLAPQLQFLADQEVLELGSLSIQAIHTPGHSAGALSYLIQDSLLTGDTLFIRDCGRTDLPTGNTTEMFSTLQRYKQLNPQLTIFPGHHYREEYWSTLGTELRTSPPLQCQSVEQLEALP